MIRQDNIQLSSDKLEFRRLYKPKGNRYLRGLESYLYHKDLKPISEAERLMKLGINPLGVRPVSANLPLPKNATPAQIQEWIIRTQAYKNPRIASDAPQVLTPGQATGGVNRELIERNAVGLVYTEAKIASARIQKIIPVY
jgi:hypothetical protein